MTTEGLLIPEDNNFHHNSECQTLDSLLQSSCETSSQSDILDNANLCDNKTISNVELCHKRNWLESVELYINSLKPKDIVIFIENVKVFSKGTVYMSDFRTLFFDNILKFLNGGEPLKTDFGRDEYTSLYSLYSFLTSSSEYKSECVDTAMIYKVMECMDTLSFVERNSTKNHSNVKNIFREAKNMFLHYNKIRNNHPKRKRYLIFITCSDILIDDINNIVEEMKAMKVRFSLFSPVQYESYVNLCEMLNYNGKGCKDLSCYYQSPKWPVTLTNGLSKAFESNNSTHIQNKKTKWNGSKDPNETNDYDFINLMSLGTSSNASQGSENIINHVPLDIMDNSLTSSMSSRPLTANDQLDQTFGPNNSNSVNVNSSGALTTSQSVLTHSKSQPKFMVSSNPPYYPSNSMNQSQINKVTQMSYYYNQDQMMYSAPNSVSVSSHPPTPSIPHSQSPQFHMGSTTHQNLLPPQPSSVPEVMKPNSVDSCNELHNQLNTQMNSQKSIPMNQESEMVQPIQKFPFVNNMSNMYSTPTNMINTNTMNPTRFTSRKPMYQSNIEPRPSSTGLFDGILTISDEYRTELRIFVDQSANLNLLSMESWEHQCVMHYVNYVDSYAISLYGKSNTDMDLGLNDNGYKVPIDLQIKMNSQLFENIFNTLASKQSGTIGIVRPARAIPPDVHVQLICFLVNRQTSTIRVLIPADPKNLFNDIKNRIPTMYPGSQTAQMYNQMKRNSLGPNQQLYNIPQNMAPMPRQIMNRYGSHNSAPMSVINNQVYRNISHPSNFINNQQMQSNPSYILHSGQYPPVPNQSSNHMISMDMGMQSNQNMYDQNTYGLN